MTPNVKEAVEIDHVIGTGWIHTHWVRDEGFPELEIRDVPMFLSGPAARLLNGVCEYMLRTGRRVEEGETMSSSGAVFRFVRPEPMPGNEDHYEGKRLQIVDLEVPCSFCGTLDPQGADSHPFIGADHLDAEEAGRLLGPVLRGLRRAGRQGGTPGVFGGGGGGRLRARGRRGSRSLGQRPGGLGRGDLAGRVGDGRRGPWRRGHRCRPLAGPLRP